MTLREREFSSIYWWMGTVSYRKGLVKLSSTKRVKNFIGFVVLNCPSTVDPFTYHPNARASDIMIQ